MAQNNLEGKELSNGMNFSTEEYNTKAMGAGKLTIEGINFIPDTLTDAVGPYGSLKIVKGHKADGEAFELMSSSAKLTKMLVSHWDAIVGKEINISGIGAEYSREYSIKLV